MKSQIIEIPRFRFIGGILIGLSYSFAFYSFLYMTREIFRILSVTKHYDLLILTDKEVIFYNLFFAYISVIISQSVCFSFWINKPRIFFENNNYQITAIVNDQRVLNWYFLNWFAKLAVIFGLLFGLTYKGGFYVFSFYPDYKYIFILIIIVLFLQTWNTIRLKFKRQSFKWMLLAFVIISFVALCLSKINLIDYKEINQHYLSKNIYHNYDLELPQSDCYERLYHNSFAEDIYVVRSKNENEPMILIEGNEVDSANLFKTILEKKSKRKKYEISRLVYQLHIDKNIKMEFINRVKKELAKSGVYQISYSVVPTNPKYDIRYYKDLILPTSLSSWDTNWLAPKDIYKRINRFTNTIEIKQNDSGKCFINHKSVETDKIKQNLKQLIENNPDYIIKFHVNDNVKFSDYLRILSYSKEVINKLRNEYSHKVFSKNYSQLYLEKESEVEKKFPLRIFELTSEFKEMISEEECTGC